jgi:hypothetical protein
MRALASARDALVSHQMRALLRQISKCLLPHNRNVCRIDQTAGVNVFSEIGCAWVFDRQLWYARQGRAGLGFDQRNVGTVEKAVRVQVFAEIGSAYRLTRLRLGLTDIG